MRFSHLSFFTFYQSYQHVEIHRGGCTTQSSLSFKNGILISKGLRSFADTEWCHRVLAREPTSGAWQDMVWVFCQRLFGEGDVFLTGNAGE
jgi:hypothetical protein